MYSFLFDAVFISSLLFMAVLDFHDVLHLIEPKTKAGKIILFAVKIICLVIAFKIVGWFFGLFK